MKRLRVWLMLAAMITTLCACGQDSTGSSELISNATPTAVPTATPVPVMPNINPGTADDSQPPAEGMLRSRLTNEWVSAEVANTRPIAVMIANEVNAVPHYNLSEASIVYEALVEGSMTRLMAIYEDWEKLDKIGNIRSLRAYYAYWAFEWDAFLVHYGGPYFINYLLEQPTTQTVDGNLGSDAGAFFRTTDRKAPHNGYANGQELENVIADKDFSLRYRDLTDDNHFLFASSSDPNTLNQYGSEAKNATYIDMSGCYPLTRCYFEYNEEDGLYYRSQHLSGDTDGPHIDAATGEQLCFKNILVQNVYMEDIGEGYLAFSCHETTLDGWFFTNGKGIHVNWAKTADYSATRFYDDAGNEILLNTGKTMICVVEQGDIVTFR